MKPDDEEMFAQLVTNMHAYYRQDVTAFVLDVWWSGCQDWNYEQVDKAITIHAKDPDKGQYCPRLADIERILRGTTTDRSALAWGRVREAIGSVGAYQDVDFGEPAIHAAIMDLGGWPKLCRTELKELTYVQHRFAESFRAYAARAGFDAPRALMGDRSPDSEYEKAGLPAPSPKCRYANSHHRALRAPADAPLLEQQP